MTVRIRCCSRLLPLLTLTAPLTEDDPILALEYDFYEGAAFTDITAVAHAAICPR
jgi:hypothetical protein